MAFTYVNSLAAGSGRQIERSYIIKNSVTVQVGDLVGFSAGRIFRAGAGAAILGLCMGFLTDKDQTLERAPTNDFDGTYTESTQTYAAASDNQTDKKIRATVLVDPLGILTGPSDATIGTTTGGNLPGYYSDVIAASDEVDESTAVTTTAQLLHIDTNASDVAKMLFVINEGVLNL